jgi:hypothetical protein
MTETTTKKTKGKPEATEPMSTEARDKLLTKSYSTATSWLRDKHMAEFNELRVKAAADLGIEWTPKPDATTLAAQTIEHLLAEHPNLRDRFHDSAEAEEPPG